VIEVEPELKEMLQRRAGEARIEPELPRPVLRRARRRRALNGALAACTAAAVVAAAFVGVQTAMHRGTRPATTPTPSGIGTTGVPFPGFWLATDRAGLAKLQREVDREPPSDMLPDPTDPEQLARTFVRVEMGWPEAAVSAETTQVSRTETRVDLWNLVTAKRAGVRLRDPDFATTITLEQLGRTGPNGVWEITDVRSGLIDLRCPSPHDVALETRTRLRLCGRLGWTPAEGHIEAVAYLDSWPTKDDPQPPSVTGEGSIGLPAFDGKLRPLPSGSYFPTLLVRLVDPEGATIAMFARRFSVTPVVTPTATPSPVPSPAPSPSIEHLAGIWPAATEERVAQLEADAAAGSDRFARPEDTASEFATSILGWPADRTAVQDVQPGSENAYVVLWNRDMGRFSPQIGLGVYLQHFAGQEPPGVWVVTRVQTGLLDVQCPSPRQDLLEPARPVMICGSLSLPPAGWTMEAIVEPAWSELQGGQGAVAADIPIRHRRFAGTVPLESDFGGQDPVVVIRLFSGDGTTLGFYAVRMEMDVRQ
jgi:hypothetical protein